MQANKIYLLLSLLCMQAYAGTVENIKIQGNKSYSDQQMQNIMGITQGQEFSNKDKKTWIRKLKATDKFKTVKVHYDDKSGECIIYVTELPGVKSIRISGNNRVPASTIEKEIGIKKNDKFYSKKADSILRRLYATGHFSDVSVEFDEKARVLTILVQERPVIKSIDIDKNSIIKKEQMDDLLHKSGIEHGHVYDPGKLKEIIFSIKSQYRMLGYKDIHVKEDVEKVGGNLVKIKLTVEKEKQFQVRLVNVKGNKAFSKDVILEKMKLNTPTVFAIMFGGNYYSDAAMEYATHNLKEFYEANGYLKMRVKNIKTEKVPDKSKVDLDIIIQEGPQYTISEVKINAAKHLKGLKFEGINKVIDKIKQQPVAFSRKKVQSLIHHIQDVLEQNGFGVQTIEPKLDADEKTHKVKLEFLVNQGKPTRVRKINFKGNEVTLDHVLRREMLVNEGETLTRFAMDESKRKMSYLGYIKSIEYTLKPIKENIVDVDVLIEEDHMSKYSAELTTDDKSRIVGSLSVENENFLGTGNSLQLKASKAYKGTSELSVSGDIPYFTQSGLGLGYKFSYEREKPSDRLNSSGATQKTVADLDKKEKYSAGLSMKVPLSTNASVEFSTGAMRHLMNKVSDNKEYATNTNLINDLFIDWGGKKQDEFFFSATLYHITLNKYFTPTKGHRFEFGASLGKFGKLPYWTTTSKFGVYKELSPLGLVINPRIAVNVGGSTNSDFKDFYQSKVGNLDNFSSLPPLKKFYGGATAPVRGVLNLGNKVAIVHTNKDKKTTSTHYDALGGDLLTTASINVFLPQVVSPLVKTSLFLDAGTVFTKRENWSTEKLVYSAGVQFDVMTPIAPLVFIIAKPLDINKDARLNEKFRKFQFTFQANIM